MNPVPSAGRLAPSPTGFLHLGNLASSLLAWAQARAEGARLVLRIEDIDTPRIVPGAAEQIVEDLRALGIDWDEGPDIGGAHAPYVQSERIERYRSALATLFERDLAYPCWCSRRDVEDALSAPHAQFDPATAYPGTCAHFTSAERASRNGVEAAVRFRARGLFRPDEQLAAPGAVDIAANPGDFVIWRRDGLVAYQLAVVVDDIAMAITDVVRGRDLLDSAPRQVALWVALGADPPRFWHVPLLLDERGQRLAKRSQSTSLRGLLAAGWTPALLRGALLLLWGWRDRFEDASVSDVIAAIDWSTLRRSEIWVPDAMFEGPRSFGQSQRAGVPRTGDTR